MSERLLTAAQLAAEEAVDVVAWSALAAQVVDADELDASGGTT